jgi:hypothetical protein
MSLEKASESIRSASKALIEWGYVLVAWPQHFGKGPRHRHWGVQRVSLESVTDSDNIGVNHALSGTCCIDVDDEGETRRVFDFIGLSYDSLVSSSAPSWIGRPNRRKFLFRAPDPPLDVKKLVVTKDGEEQTVLEFRGASSGKAVQDVLPPSIHPDTGAAYRWLTQPVANSELPPLPPLLEEVWRNWDGPEGWGKRLAESLSGQPLGMGARRQTQLSPMRRSTTLDIVADFNRTYSANEILERNGYERRGDRYLRPGSSTKAPGTVVFDDGKAFSHDGGTLNDGKPHDAFDLYRILECGGDRLLAFSKLRGEISSPERPVATLMDRVVPLVDGIDLHRERPAIIEKILPEGEVTLLVGHGGAGKSYVALNLAIHVALGRAFANLAVQRVPVLFYSAEDEKDDLLNRVSRICRALGCEPSELSGWLHLVDMSNIDATLFADGVEFTHRLGELQQLIDKLGVGLVVIDNASDTYAAEENNRAKVRAFVRGLKIALARTPSRALLLLMHVDKASARARGSGVEVTDQYSGSTAWHNSARSRLGLEKTSDGLLKLSHHKANHSQLAEPIELTWVDGAPQVRNSNSEAARIADALLQEEREKASAKNERRLLALLADFQSRGELIPTAMTGPSTVYRALSKADGYPRGLAADACNSLLRRLEREGRIVRREVRTPQRKWREVFELRDLSGDGGVSICAEVAA